MNDFKWTFPYSSQRMPVLARNVVATSQPVAAQAGLDMLRQGGNAADAAVATAIAMTVLEPTSNGIGSDAFAMIWADGKLHGLNGSGPTPKALNRSHFEGMTSMPQLGWDAVAIPGAVSAWAEVSKRFGKLPFEKLFEHAIACAADGFLVAPQTAVYWSKAVDRFKDFPTWGQTFLKNGRSPMAGELFRMPDHAATLRSIAATHGESFYRGDLAKKIVACSAQQGGAMAMSDLSDYQAQWVDPICVDYHNHRLHEMPPNGQGLAALMALGILRHHKISELPPDSTDVLHLQIEAMKLAFADGHQYIADPRYMKVTAEHLLDPTYLASRAKLIDPKLAGNFQYGLPPRGGTILLCAADAQGMMVTFIQSNYGGFGSGVVIPDTGIALSNRAACFTLEKGHPNEVAGGKKPYHTIIPGFVTRDGQPLMAYGIMGGYMQAQAHLQVLSRIADFGQNPQAALDAPRWRLNADSSVSIEAGLAPAVYDELRQRGHQIEIAQQRDVGFGRGQVIYKLADGYCAASDLRADGQAVGY